MSCTRASQDPPWDAFAVAIVNEMTTVASVWTHAQFLDDASIKGNALGLKITAGNEPLAAGAQHLHQAKLAARESGLLKSAQARLAHSGIRSCTAHIAYEPKRRTSEGHSDVHLRCF